MDKQDDQSDEPQESRIGEQFQAIASAIVSKLPDAAEEPCGLVILVTAEPTPLGFMAWVIRIQSMCDQRKISKDSSETLRKRTEVLAARKLAEMLYKAAPPAEKP